MTKIEKYMPKEIGEAQQEIMRMREAKKKMVDRIALLAVFAILLGMIVGGAVGYDSGYHAALVDFKIITGMMI